jgi:putative transposase
LLTPHAVYSSLGANEADRLANYRSLFRPELDTDAISDIRMALDQGQPLGDARFIDSIERATGHRRETRPQGRSRKAVLEETGPQDQMPLDV